MATVKRAVRPAVKQVPAALAVLLDEGDSVEYAMTAEFKHPRKGSFWVKLGASTTVRPGEDEEDAKARLVEFVTEGIEEQIAELKA